MMKDNRNGDRRKTDRRVSERVFEYSDGVAAGLVFLDKLHNCYRVEIRDGEMLLHTQEVSIRKNAITIARNAVQYLNKRGK